MSSTLDSPSAVRPVACLNCRGRRTYCSKEKPKCAWCQKYGVDCIYEDSRKVPVNESYLRALEAKAKAYDELDLKSPESRDASAPEVSSWEERTQFGSSAEERGDEFEDEHALLEPFTGLSIDRPSTSFKGPGNSDDFLLTVRKLSGIYGNDGNLDQNAMFYDPEALPSRRKSVTSRVRLPPRDVARRLFAAQHTYIGTIFSFTNPATFDDDLTAAYRGPPDPEDREACLAYAKLLVLLAFGQLYSVNQWIDFTGPPGFEFFAQALKLLPDPHEEGSILCAETLALTGYFMQNMNRRDAAFLYIGMALRMAISLGLHQEVTSSPVSAGQNKPPVLDEFAREHRRRVWWSIYSLDRIVSVKSGNPLTIQDEDIGVALPSRLPTEDVYCQGVVVHHYTELSRILSEVTKAVYRKSNDTPKSGKRLMASVQRIIQALSKWDEELPDGLRFDPAKLSISRESVSTFGHYYQCINMLARPLLYHVVQKRLQEIRMRPEMKEREWKEGFSQTTIRVIEMCVSAARETIKMFTLAAQRDLVATYGYMDTEHVFCAGIVLVMVCISFPTNEANILAMKAGLELLRNMVQRGNSHMAARYEHLEHLRSVVMPGDSMLSPKAQSLTSFPNHFTAPAATEFQSPLTAELVAAQAAMPVAGFTPRAIPTVTLTEMNRMAQDYAEGEATSVEMPSFSMANGDPQSEGIYDENTSSGMDFILWEEGFANPAFDAGYDITQWAHEAQMDMGNSVAYHD